MTATIAWDPTHFGPWATGHAENVDIRTPMHALLPFSNEGHMFVIVDVTNSHLFGAALGSERLDLAPTPFCLHNLGNNPRMD